MTPLASLRVWMEPQERFEELRSVALRAGGARLADLSYANAWDGPSDAAREVLAAAARAAGPLELQYTPYGGQPVARRVAAHELRARTGEAFQPRHVVLTTGAMSALSLLLRAVARPGANVVLTRPCWLDHPLYAAACGLEPRLVDLREDFALDVEALLAAVDDGTCAVLIAQPNNPSGRVHEASTLRAIAEGLGRRAEPPLFIADECHRDYARDCPSMVRFYARTSVVYSYGKRLLLQGQRLGYAAVSPRAEGDLPRTLERLARAGGYCTPTALMQRALPALDALTPELGALFAKRERLSSALEERGYQVAEGETMFVYGRVPPVGPAGTRDDWDFAEALARRGVLVLPGSVFHHRGWFRLCAAARGDMVERALAVLSESAGERGG